MLISDIPLWAADATGSILQAVLKKDPFTFYHCCRVGQAARKLGEVLGAPEYELAIFEYSGLFHDIGKIGVPDHILLKPARLTSDENKVMQNHAEMSVEMVRPLTRHAFFRHLIPGIRYHHERFDGKGYPHGIAGEKIPISARIVAIVDAVDAMLNTRPYRQAQSLDYVLKELVDYSGTQFDPNLVRAYLDAFKRGYFDQDQRDIGIVVPSILRAA